MALILQYKIQTNKMNLKMGSIFFYIYTKTHINIQGKGLEQDIPNKQPKKKNFLANLISDKTDFKPKLI